MDGNSWKGLSNFGKGLVLFLLGLILCIIFYPIYSISPGGYTAHVFMRLSVILTIFGPILFWIVLPLKKRWYDKGKHKRFYTVMAPISLIFLIFLGATFLPPETPISSVTTEVVDHEGTPSVKVTLEGKKDSYHLILSDPEKNWVNGDTIDSSEMSDGRETTWLSLAGYHTQAKTGTYTLTVKDLMGNTVYEDEFTYSGS